MARHPRPTKIKILQGEPNKNRINYNEPQPTKNTTPPRFLSKLARNEWRRLAPDCEKLDLLKNTDRMIFAEYCQTVGILEEVENEISRLTGVVIRKGGSSLTVYLSQTKAGTLGINPLMSLRKHLVEQLHMLAVEFGMTPVSRSRINAQPKPKDEDPMERLLNEIPDSEK